jgi:hypothetical protein
MDIYGYPINALTGAKVVAYGTYTGTYKITASPLKQG